VLQCVAACCSVLQCVAVCCSVLQCVAVCCSVLIETVQPGCGFFILGRGRSTATPCTTLRHTATHRNTLQHTATHYCVESMSKKLAFLEDLVVANAEHTFSLLQLEIRNLGLQFKHLQPMVNFHTNNSFTIRKIWRSMFQKFRRRRLDAIVYIVYIQTHIYKIKCVESTFKRVATISRLYKIIDLFCKSAL